MREILFRGYSKKFGWVFGDYSKVTQNIPSYIYPRGQKLIIIEGIAIAVCDKSIGQYTGLLDKSNDGIFEGDILEFTDDNGDEYLCEVFWDDDLVGWSMRDTDGVVEDCSYWNPRYYKIVGNVYENPDLLKESENDV